jgi:serine acetyltransferase
MKVFGEWREFGRCLRRDAERYAELLGWWREMGFWVGATYRFGHWARTLPLPLKLPALLLHKLVRIPWILFLNVNIPAGARIGPGLCLIHPHNVYIPAGGEIGENFLVFHEVTLGTGPLPPGWPRIGNGVDVYVGAKILGGVTVGDGAKIGANCVVNRNVAPGSVVVMAPNRVVPASLVEAFGPNRPFAQGMPGTPAAATREVPGVAAGPAPEPEEPEVAKAR